MVRAAFVCCLTFAASTRTYHNMSIFNHVGDVVPGDSRAKYRTQSVRFPEVLPMVRSYVGHNNCFSNAVCFASKGRIASVCTAKLSCPKTEVIVDEVSGARLCPAIKLMEVNLFHQRATFNPYSGDAGPDLDRHYSRCGCGTEGADWEFYGPASEAIYHTVVHLIFRVFLETACLDLAPD